MFADGLPLLAHVDAELAVDISLFSAGGREILQAIKQQGYDVLRARPVITKRRKAALLLRAFIHRLSARPRT
jgi:phytoene/squalene synthetase